MIQKPTEINILGIRYTVTYASNPADVDIYKRQTCWGQIDYWTRTIRIYDNGRPIEDIWQTILHEVLHGIGELLHIDTLMNDQNKEETIGLLALALADVATRNKWWELG